jgi:Caenorhabditis protein of unknown function, DUF268
MRQIGIDPVALIRGLGSVPRYLRHLLSFLILTESLNFRISPALLDFRTNSGSSDGHYFWQDLLCAQWIFQESPSSHFDVGSRIDGFISHLLSFREVTLLDIRPNILLIPNLKTVIGDAQVGLEDFKNSFDSVSSLHSIEHFGLGRYGDTLQVDGHVRGLENIAACVKINGFLYVSFPVGVSKVEFNSQRIIDPLWPLEILQKFELVDFILIPWKGQPVLGAHPSEVDKNKTGQAGLYKFRRLG